MSLSQALVHGSVVGPAFRCPTTAGLDRLPLSEVEIPAIPVTPFLSDSLETLLKTEFAKAGYTIDAMLRPPGRFDDDRYYLPSVDELRTVIDARPTRDLGSEEDIFDCEDFAYVFRGFAAQHHFLDLTATDTLAFAVGMIWGSGFKGLNPFGHVVNFAVCAEHRVWIIDTSRADALARKQKKTGAAPAPLLQWSALTPLTPGFAHEIHYIVI